MGIDDLASGRIGVLDINAGLRIRFDTRICLLAHGLQCPHPAFIAGAAGFDALPDPGFLLFQFLVEQTVFPLFRHQRLRLRGFKLPVIARPAG